ncbi:hypothetical protein E0H26_14405 [Micromonospora zingiberis]|uniref:CBM6 domain-containing protein n=1 Tax=Micromonospora zingiberis TaxID=2053011 RepID=A0A4R0GJY3_9ACTN|nr:hypothetical protein [Micromonospora zingiberis]TCB96802.1 hypothetical protein E0H26_14405 [Micromonospora zingiberis]
MPNEAGSPDADPIPRILGSAPRPDRSSRTRQWVGIGTLTGAIALAAIAVPPLLASTESPPVSSPETVATPVATSAPTEPAASAPGESPSPTPSPERTAPAAGPTPSPSTRTAAPAPPPTTSAASPSATSSRSTAPPSLRPVSVEAEDPGNVLGEGAGIVACSACAGGARVRYLGTLSVYLTNPTAGPRTVTVAYTVDGSRELKISINGAAPTNHFLTGTAWDTPRTFRYTTTVPAGRVSFTFYNDTGPSPDIDKITIS